jgi:hypothetical protein
MLSVLDNAQLKQLKKAIEATLVDYEIVKCDENKQTETDEIVIEKFLSAKRVEGCSEKSLRYYKSTIMIMLGKVEKSIDHITTDDLREYLTVYQSEKNSSKVTIDNIRRILSSFFSWLEDEDYILKSPVRRIHKVRAAATIKETYPDEALELMRDARKTVIPNTFAKTAATVIRWTAKKQSDTITRKRRSEERANLTVIRYIPARIARTDTLPTM